MTTFFEQIYSEYKNQVYFFVKKYLSSDEDIEDVVQEIFVHLWKHSDQLKDSSVRDAIVFKSAKQEISAFYRREKLSFNSLETEPTSLQAFDVLPEVSLTSYDGFQKQLEEALSQVPPRSKEIFLDNKLSGKSYSEIAEEYGISKTAVEKHVNKVLCYLRTHLKYLGEDGAVFVPLLMVLSFL